MSLNLFPTSIYSRNISRHPLFTMQREMSKLFENLNQEESTSETLKSFSPRVDIIENEASYSLTAELPGVEEEDINIAVRDNNLTISAEKKSSIEKDSEGKHYIERSYGKFERIFALGDQVNEDGIEASFRNGVLHLTLPKKEVSKPEEKKIEIRSKDSKSH